MVRSKENKAFRKKVVKKKTAVVFLFVILLVASFLRLWKIQAVPVSLFGDELDVGYHAYSILKTGKDYSGNYWPLHFQSLAEWRTPLYLYSVVPTVALFGISPLGVRLPASIFGILSVLAIYLLIRELTKNEVLSLVSAAILAISPWHIQYSRAAFEVTQLLLFLLLGLYFFFKSLSSRKENGKYLWVAVIFLVLTTLVYSTAKLFTPLLFILLFILWHKEILAIGRKYLILAIIAGIISGLPAAYSTILGGGTQRFSYISVFTDPTIETEIGVARQLDSAVRGEVHEGLKPSFEDRLMHNKVVFWGKSISNNLLQSFSTDFLFVNGDPNLRHSIDGMGQFYKVEALALVLGLVLFFTSKSQNHRIKLFMLFWILAGAIPSAITRDGGRHATRLILILPPLVFLVSCGLVEGFRLFKGKTGILLATFYLLFLAVNFVFYQHNYWVHNPWHSERWWHAGWGEAIHSIKEVEKDYSRVIISMSGEPAWIFFAAYYQYPPDKWQEEFPIGNDVYLEGFGKISHTGKFYFGSPKAESGGIYALPNYISEKDLYLANATEVGENLIRNPEKTPIGLRLVRAVAYPSGEPAFYLFTGEANQ